MVLEAKGIEDNRVEFIQVIEQTTVKIMEQHKNFKRDIQTRVQAVAYIRDIWSPIEENLNSCNTKLRFDISDQLW